MESVEFNRSVKSVRTVKRAITWLERPSLATGWHGALQISVDKRTDLYLIRPIESDLGGDAFELEKLDENLKTVEVYHVLLFGRDSSCNCKGFIYHGKPCKHLDGLKCLAARGELPWPRQKHVACNHCQTLVEAPGLCPTCQGEAEAQYAADWEAQLRESS